MICRTVVCIFRQYNVLITKILTFAICQRQNVKYSQYVLSRILNVQYTYLVILYLTHIIGLGLIQGSFFANWNTIQNPAFYVGQWYTGKIICQIWAMCLNNYQYKNPSRSSTTQIGGIESSFHFANWYFQCTYCTPGWVRE